MTPDAEREELRNAVATLRRRLLLLAKLLPTEHLRLLDADLEELEAETFAPDLLAGLSDSVALTAGDVETALREVWSRSQY